MTRRKVFLVLSAAACWATVDARPRRYVRDSVFVSEEAPEITHRFLHRAALSARLLPR
jgi:hypothetical protein